MADWVRDEVILALDLFVSAGALRGGSLPSDRDPKVIALSKLLNDLPIHPVADRGPKFRNAGSVHMKLANLRAAERTIRLAIGEAGADGLPRGMGRGAAVDREVFEEFRDRWGDLAQEAMAIRTMVGESVPVPESDETLVTDAPVDGGGVPEYERSSVDGGRGLRTEADLVKRYADHMEQLDHEVIGRRYRVAGESRPFRADLFLRDLNVLVEAKANPHRGSVRMAIGQLLDYQRYEHPTPDLAVLLPSKPSGDLMDLLSSLSISCIWEHAGGFTDSTGKRTLSK